MLIVALVALWLALDGGEAPEPLDAGAAGDLSQRLELGQTFADADVYLFNRSEQPLTLERVEVIAKGPNVPKPFRLLVAGPGRTTDVQGGADLRCPPSFFKANSIGPVRGFTLQPRSTATGKEGAVLITCFEAPIDPGRFEVTHLRITYTSDGERRTTTIPRRLFVCSAANARCDPTPIQS